MACALILAAALLLSQDAAPSPRPGDRESRGAQAEQPRGEEDRDEQPTAADRRTSAALADLLKAEQGLTSGWLERNPSLARRRGLQPRDDALLVDPSEDTLTWSNSLQRAIGTLAVIPPGNLSEERRDDREWLGRWASARISLGSLLRQHRWDPAPALREPLAMLRGILTAGELGPDSKAEVLTAQLGAMPEHLSGARKRQIFPSAEASAYASLVAADLEHFLAVELVPALEAQGPSPELWRPLESANREARASVKQHRDWLVRLAEGSERTQVLGPQAWTRLAHDLPGAEVKVGRLKSTLLRNIGSLDHELGGYRVLTPANPEARSPDAICQSAETVQALAWQLATALGLVAGPIPPLNCETAMVQSPASEVVEARVGERLALVFVVDGLSWSDGIRRQRVLDLDPAAQRAMALQHGLPGEALWERWARSSERAAQRELWNPCRRAGWGLFAADWMTRIAEKVNPFAQDTALRAAVIRLRMLEAARLYGSLRLHAEGASLNEVSRELRALIRLEPEAAAHEVRRSLLDPSRGMGYLGYLQLRQAETDLQKESDPLTALRAVALSVQRSPSTPQASIQLPQPLKAPGGEDAGKEDSE